MSSVHVFRWSATDLEWEKETGLDSKKSGRAELRSEEWRKQLDRGWADSDSNEPIDAQDVSTQSQRIRVRKGKTIGWSLPFVSVFLSISDWLTDWLRLKPSVSLQKLDFRWPRDVSSATLPRHRTAHFHFPQRSPFPFAFRLYFPPESREVKGADRIKNRRGKMTSRKYKTGDLFGRKVGS